MRNRTENKIALVMIRHGATKFNIERRYLGKTDAPLSEEGEKELRRNKKLKLYKDIDCLFTSPMKRCLRTAGLLYPDMETNIIEEWTEMDFGDFEGRNYKELKDDKRYQAFIDSGGVLPFPNGESREAFSLRCKRGFEKMIGEFKKLGDEKALGTIGMIVHGGTIMALLAAYGGGDYFYYQAPNGGGYECTLKIASDIYEFIDIRKIEIR